MKRLAVLLIAILMVAGCAITQTPKDSTFADRAKAVCSDLDAAVLLAQIGLSYAQQSNWAFDYGQAQKTLVDANSTLKMMCAAAQTDGDLLTVRNAVLQALAKAQQEQAEVKKWKET